MKKVSDLRPATHRISEAELLVLKKKAFCLSTDICPVCGVLMQCRFSALEWIHPITDYCKVKRVYYNSLGRAL